MWLNFFDSKFLTKILLLNLCDYDSVTKILWLKFFDYIFLTKILWLNFCYKNFVTNFFWTNILWQFFFLTKCRIFLYKLPIFSFYLKGKHFVTYRHFCIPFFIFAGEYYKVTILIYWTEVLPFVGLKESIIRNLQTR